MIQMKYYKIGIGSCSAKYTTLKMLSQG